MEIGIAGFGFVGQALYNSLKDKESVRIYDKYKFPNYSIDNLLKCDVVFICLPTNNTDGKQDLTAFDEVFGKLGYKDGFGKKSFHGIAVVKSTILYENLEKYAENVDVIMNPEFLNQNTSLEDFANQEVMFLGGRVDLCDTVKEVYNTHFNLDCEYEYVTMEQACEFKYLRNIYGAYKVLFWNFVNETFNTDVRMLKSMLDKMPQGDMATIAADGEYGFGGACLPKDLQAKHTSVKHDLSKFMLKYNRKLRK